MSEQARTVAERIAREYDSDDGGALQEVEAILNAYSAAIRQEQSAHVARLRQALQLVEAVYRCNCVAEGEPSSVLDAIHAALQEPTQEPTL